MAIKKSCSQERKHTANNLEKNILVNLWWHSIKVEIHSFNAMREGRIISINRQWWAYQSQWLKPVNTLLSSFAAKRKKYEIQNFLRNFRMSMSSVVQNACTCMEISCRKLFFFVFCRSNNSYHYNSHTFSCPKGK